MPLSADLANKSIQAAIAAIEIYNKPNFFYREEAFSLLMTNAFELLFKAKWLLDRDEQIESLHDVVKDKSGVEKPKVNRSGNPISHSLTYLAARLLQDKNSGVERGCFDNILALVEIRDNAAHLLNKDIYIGRRVQQIGTASLQNYLMLATEWFSLDLSIYNFYLMPISFYHGFEAAAPVTRANYTEQIQKLLAYIDSLEAADSENNGSQHVAMRLETHLVREKDVAAIPFRFTDDPHAPAMSVREEDILKNYPMTYLELTEALRRRYSDFVINEKYVQIRRDLENETKFCFARLANPKKPQGSKQRFYNANVFPEFDKHYTRRKK